MALTVNLNKENKGKKIAGTEKKVKAKAKVDSSKGSKKKKKK